MSIIGNFRTGKILGLILAAILMGRIVLAEEMVVIRDAPPRPVARAHIVRPGPAYIWIEGYYRWDGMWYLWVPGAWVLPPRPHAHWVESRYVHRNGGWVFVAGHWRY